MIPSVVSPCGCAMVMCVPLRSPEAYDSGAAGRPYDPVMDTAPARTSTVVVDRLDAATLLELTGWHLEPKGACRDDVCVLLPESLRTDVEAIADRLGAAVVADPINDLWAVGPEARSHALAAAALPDLTLSRADGTPFALRSLLGRRGVLAAWASW
jgi:hypothetical protein